MLDCRESRRELYRDTRVCETFKNKQDDVMFYENRYRESGIFIHYRNVMLLRIHRTDHFHPHLHIGALILIALKQKFLTLPCASPLNRSRMGFRFLLSWRLF